MDEVARCIAILEAIDRDLDERGLVDRAGKPRYLLNHRWRVSRQLAHWLEKISSAIERQSAAERQSPSAGRADYVRELERIALGQDATASARDRLAALKELVQLDSAAAAQRVQSVVQLHITREGDVEFIEQEGTVGEGEAGREQKRG